MRARRLLVRGLLHYWRAHVAVIAGVAAAAAALGGSLVVGDSVRGSLARTALDRLGRTTHAVEGVRFFREALGDEIAARPAFRVAFQAAAPIVQSCMRNPRHSSSQYQHSQPHFLCVHGCSPLCGWLSTLIIDMPSTQFL